MIPGGSFGKEFSHFDIKLNADDLISIKMLSVFSYNCRWNNRIHAQPQYTKYERDLTR